MGLLFSRSCRYEKCLRRILANAKPNYRPQASDTSIEADIYLFARLRQLSLKQRVEMFATFL
ncbi:hypothetical protein H6G96_33115 [Nostoc sp. FACHB-892]|uniref:hypothetical protein n=1 Tax=Nostoc sp. FACHB-892 TaxID=2692843 RepID=UPI0005EAC7EA|nr:hypothetical protein [Nostoc sp. FACHB-892]EKE96666.1 hypothetical protein FDUTEX481_06420 [Tolypothrix sp. PCC 7601]MBD2731026.1 hypothetical protein [Nostoc sp. FACHB-892]OUL29911.1 hypothetical protein BV378_05050 [Nostoc sp. RF31YmG]